MDLSPTKLFQLLLVVMLFLPGCKKEEPNPELRDPIYLDLLAETSSVGKLLIEEEKNLEDIIKKRAGLLPRTLEIKLNRREEVASKRKIEIYRQKHKYLEIRTERRRIEGRREYRISFKNNKSWPDPDEHKYYLINKKLRNAPSNWSLRVPKLHKRSPNYNEKDAGKSAKK